MVRLLAAVAPDAFSHCEFYGPVGCCRAIPCTRPVASLHLQKNHDFELNVPNDLDGCLYVIQHREPAGAAVSDREFYVRVEGAAVGASREDHEVWLGRKAAHFVGFERRWVQSPPRNSICIDYADLSADPVATVARLLTAAGLTLELTAIHSAADGLATVGDFAVPNGYVPRPLVERSGFDGDLLPHYETLIIDELPVREAAPLLTHVARDPDAVFELAYQAASAELAGSAERATAAVERGLAVSPHHPLLLHWRGRLAWRAGDLTLARRCCEEAVGLLPDHPMLRAELAQIAHVQGDFATARSHDEALRALREPDPGHDVHLAMVLSDLGDRDAAQMQIARACARRPTEPIHWAYLVRAAITNEQPAVARAIAEEALAIWPGHPDLVAINREASAVS